MPEPAPLSDAKRLLLERYRHGGAASGSLVRPPHLASTYPTTAPLSPAQHRLWLHAQLEPESPVYILPCSLHLRGPLDEAALQQSLDAVVARHEPLRTTIEVAPDGTPFQQIGPPTAMETPFTDLSRLDPLEQDAALRDHEDAEAIQPFDLARGPLFRVALLRRGPEEHVLLLTVHHIVFDGSSIDVLMDDWSALYAAFAAGKAPALEPLPTTFGALALRETTPERESAREAQLPYWTKSLAAMEPLKLPFVRSHPTRARAGARLDWTLPTPVVADLKALARREGVTLYIVLLAALHVLLHRYTGADDIPVGSPAAGRSERAGEKLIGFFVNTLVLRGDLGGDPTFTTLLKRTRQTVLDAFEHQDIAFERVVSAVGHERTVGATPLFDVLLNYSTPHRHLTAGPLDVRALWRLEQTTKVPLTLYASEENDVLACTLYYDRASLAADDAARVRDHFAVLLGDAALRPDQPLSALTLLPADERRQIDAWSQGPSIQYGGETIHDLIAAQAARVPGRVAVVVDDDMLTYGDLDRRSDEWAAALRARGVGRDVRVALYLDRSTDLVVGLLAVLKAGGAYVPIDPAFPPGRVAHMRRDSGAALVLTHRALLPALGARAADVLCLDDGPPLSPTGAAVGMESGPEGLVYVIYTSGSTGLPKGVAVEHRQLRNYVGAMLDRMALPDGARYAAVSTVAADLGHTAIFPALCAGGELHLISTEKAADPAAFVDYCRRRPLDMLKITPSHLAALLDADGAAALLPRACLVLGGESSTWALVAKVRALAPPCRVLNHYGPTETTVGVLTCDLGAETSSSEAPAPPLGRPLANGLVHVLDPHGAPAPVGVPGELFIGGAGVARGYLDRPDLTAGRFAPDPFAAAPDARMYRSGDRVRWNTSGQLEYLGRLDAQVKIRGYRVELGEIEGVLSRLAAVAAAAVALHDDGRGDAALIGYVVPEPGVALDPNLLSTGLAVDLPSYMCPQAIVVLATLPLTANGKLDRAALPKPNADAGTGEPGEPRTPTERALAAIWSDLLGGRAIGRSDDFFLLGGHSLLVIRALAQVQKDLGVSLPPRALFDRPTLVTFAAAVDAQRAQPPTGPTTAPLKPAARVAYRAPSRPTSPRA